eukprot:scaffold63869_cov29-Phaeocystis_antarctica.AAC.1
MHEARELGMPRLATIVEGGEAAHLGFDRGDAHEVALHVGRWSVGGGTELEGFGLDDGWAEVAHLVRGEG